MKLLVSAYACNPKKGSEEGNGWNMAYEMSKLGHEVWCFTNKFGKKEIEAFLENEPNDRLHMVFVELPTWVEKLYRYQAGVYFHYIYWQSRAAKIARRLHKQHRFDLVHHITLASPQLGSGSWQLKIPFVYGPLGGGQAAPKGFERFFYEWLKQEKRRDQIGNLLLKLNPNTYKALKKASLVMVTNEETHNLVARYGAKKIEYFLDTSLPEDFMPAQFPERKPDQTLKLLWVGRLFARKGLPLVLEALTFVKEDIPISLTIVGDGPLGYKVNDLIKAYHIEHRVNWIGRIPWEDVKQAYLDHDVFVLCSLRDSFGSQFLEAMAYGLPIITLNHQGTKIFVPDEAGIKIDVKQPEDTCKQIALAIEELYHHSEKRTEMGKKGFLYASDKTWTQKVKEINRKYLNLVPEKEQLKVL
ncbi:MAG: glycosyltransferase family 4 protein [Microscillaceae bacterium]|nr:glycosyltransferase family 4 protein [Microscillaceae bacterium]